MSRYKPDPVVRGDDWDLDEEAVLKGSYGFLELERVRYRIGLLQALPPVTNEDELLASAQAFARVILEIYRNVTLRRPETPYQPGIDRARFDFTEDDLIVQPTETLAWLATRGMEHVLPLLGTPKVDPQTGESITEETTEADITPAAREVGLTARNFPAGEAAGGGVPAGEVGSGVDQPAGGV